MAEAVAEAFSAPITELADKLVNLSVKDAQSLVDCLKDVHGIEPAGGGVIMADAGAGASEEEAEEQTSFDVVLESYGEQKIQVIKVVRTISGLGLKEAKELVESAPKAIKEGVTKEEADKIRADIEAVGGAISIK